MHVKAPNYFNYSENQSDEKYVFISYSHKNYEEVYEDLSLLYEQGVNYWYDASIDPGDLWNEKAKSVIEDPKCVGVIFFVSKDLIKSQACYEEIKLCHEKMKSDKNFRILSVHLNGLSSMKIISQIFNEIPVASLDEYHERVKEALIAFPHNKIFIARNQTTREHISILVKLLQEIHPKLVSNKTSYLKQLLDGASGFIKKGENYYLKQFGNYAQESVKSNMPLLLPDGYAEVREEQYLCLNRQYYEFDPVDWILLDYKEDELIFAVSVVIDYVRMKEINSFLIDMKKMLFKNKDNDLSYIEISVLDEQYLNTYKNIIPKANPTKYVIQKSQNGCMMIWVKRNDDYIICSEDFVLMRGNNFSNYSAGLIVTIKIKANKLIEKMEEKYE